jgi:tetratricopeptide (TPR) repeat protein
VAWVAERKDVLSTFFWMLTLGAYSYYVEHPDKKRYLLTLAFFALGLMAKPMLVTLPFALLLLDYWPLGRFQAAGLKPAADPKTEAVPVKESKKQKRKKQKREEAEPAAAEKTAGVAPASQSWENLWPLVREKIPFLVLSALISVATLIFIGKSGQTVSYDSVSFIDRVGNALISYVRYIVKMFWPQDLGMVYPYPESPPLWKAAGAGLILIAITVLLIRAAKRFPYAVVGWFWFLGILFPVMGLFQAGAREIMADRFTYVPLIGLFIIAAWGVPEAVKTWPNKNRSLAVAAGTVLVVLSVATLKQVQFWEKDIVLFRHSISIDYNNPRAHMRVGDDLKELGRLDEAIYHYREALRIDPSYKWADNQLGAALASQGRYEEAIVHFNRALEFDPDDVLAHDHMAIALATLGRNAEALNHFSIALRLKPDDPKMHFYLAAFLAQQGRLDEAIFHYREALRLKPDNPRVHNDLGIVFGRKGQLDQAISEFQAALRIKPDLKAAQDNLQVTLAMKKKAR